VATTDIQPARALGSGSITPVTFLRIQSANSALFLQPDGDGSGAGLTQQPEADDPRQLWAFIQADATSYRIFNAYSGYSIDAAGNSSHPGDGTKVQQFAWRPGQLNQQWVFDVNSRMFVSDYTYDPDAPDNWMVWDVKSRSVNPGAPVQLYQNNGQSNQKWNLIG
jgi:ricin-type beta-trefoil lectin protein